MMTTASLEESLQAVESQLRKLEKAADAEISFMLNNSAESNPWAGACKRRDEMRQEARDLRSQIRGVELRQMLAEFEAVNRELEAATAQRERADTDLMAFTQLPVIAKWLNAASVAQHLGYEHSWTIYCSQWFLSERGDRGGAPECAAFFWDPQCPEPLKFNIETDRVTIRNYREAVGAADLALMQQQGAAEKRQRMLQDRPELSAVA